MGNLDKAKNAAQQAKGRVKEDVGRATDNPRLRRKGRADQAKARFKRAGEKVKDAFRA